MDLTSKLSSGVFVVSGVIVGNITLNPIILSSLSSLGVPSNIYSETKYHKRKMEICRFPYTTCDKVLVDLRAAIRGHTFDLDYYLEELKTIDSIVIDICPNVERFKKQYKKKFTEKEKVEIKRTDV